MDTRWNYVEFVPCMLYVFVDSFKYDEWLERNMNIRLNNKLCYVLCSINAATNGNPLRGGRITSSELQGAGSKQHMTLIFGTPYK
ncbi:jg5335 [Pararge aegeria aegeria]|uniref:Jg5335 protein n=1 Tax=Pararge aegeria aegeria TaxID=348720 RepID=A0A8S4R9K9_9NEOP|nr:jg5335 [Pararge aegeria aegeria]